MKCSGVPRRSIRRPSPAIRRRAGSSRHFAATVTALVLVLLALCTDRGHAAESGPWEQGPGYRRLPLAPAAAALKEEGFTRLAPSSLGIDFTNRCSPARYAKRQNLMNGAGVALGDFDGDGWCDVYFCNREGANGLYRNLGNWTFTNVTAQAGVAATNLISSGALFADLNGDGWLDLHVTSFLGPDALFLNRGDGTFSSQPDAGGLATPGGATSSAAADLDGDGDLDVYVTRFAMEALLRDGSVIATRMVGGQPVASGRAGKRIRILNGKMYEYGEPDFLFLNDGKGRFTAVSWKERFTDESGHPVAEAPPDLGFAVQMRDINEDGFPDIYVCNDFQTPDRIWINDGTGRFRALSHTALRNMSYASMGVDFADIDRDGHLDFYTVEMLPKDQRRHMTHVVRGADPDLRQPRNPLVRDAFSRSILSWNQGDGTYAEIAWFAGVATSDWSWTPAFLDVDLDGFEDLLVSSGYPHDVNDLDLSGGAGRGDGRAVDSSFTDQLLRYPPLDSPQIAWRNNGNLTFEDVSQRWGFDFRVVTHGLAFADLDNDGDLDVVGNSFNAAPLLCRNEASRPRIGVRLKGRGSDTSGTGARIRVLHGAVPVQEQEMLTGGRYLSCDHAQRTFAASRELTPMTIEVRWRDGSRSSISNALPNSLYVIDAAVRQDSPTPTPSAATPTRALWVEQKSAGLPTHQDPGFDEFSRQTLLPWRQSFQGPGIVWIDGDDAAPDSLLLGNGRSGRLQQTRIRWDQNRLTAESQAVGDPLPDDGLGLLTFATGAGPRSLFAALARYESGASNSPAALHFQHEASGTWKPMPGLAPFQGSPGPMAAGDLDHDGDLDLVIGARSLAGQYPHPASAVVYTNHLGVFAPDLQASAALSHVGIASGLLLTDLSGDTYPELVVACEWGPLRVFTWNAGRLEERTQALGLSKTTGLWQGLAAGDFDGDGRQDLAVGNWGRNSYQQRAPKGPWRLYYGDFGAGRTAILETYFHPEFAAFVPVRTRTPLSAEFPWLAAAFPTHAAFSRASAPELLGEHAAQAATCEATTLASMVLLNRGDHFDAIELPAPAQWTPVFGFAAADFDGDGDVDLVALQNFFAIRDEEDRLDSGRCLALLNDGHGAFSAATATESGLSILGEQRGAAVGDFDRDGRADLAVAVNSGPVTLWRNTSAPAAIRVRIKGPPLNPDGIGATVRLQGEGGWGPRHELRAGSGRFSQDSRVLLVGPLAHARKLEVRFPGSSPRLLDLTPNTPEVTVDPSSGR